MSITSSKTFITASHNNEEEEDDVYEMQEWLLAQSEKLQNTIVTVASGMSISPALYFGTRRTTYSDVISIVTTSTPLVPFTVDAIRKARKKGAPLYDSIYESPFGKLQVHKKIDHERRKAALLNENMEFMSTLSAKRNARKLLEQVAANVIQRVYRGFSIRKNFEKLKKKLGMRKKVRAGLSQITAGTTLILEEKDRHRRQGVKEAKAVRVIQKRFRVKLANRVLSKLRQMKKEEHENQSMTKIQSMLRASIAQSAVRKVRRLWRSERRLHLALHLQRFTRGRLARKHTCQKRFRLLYFAAFMLQNQVRIYLARKVIRKEKHRRVEEDENRAALLVQRIYRGKCARQYVLALRIAEKHEIRLSAILYVQRVSRGRQGRRMATERRRRQHMEKKWCATLFLQKIIRGFIGNCRYKAALEEAKFNIFTQTRLGNMDQVDDIFSGFIGDQCPTVTDVDVKGNTILLIACQWGHKKIVRKSLRWGMEINHENKKGETGLSLSILFGHEEIAEYLLSKKAEFAFYGRTLLHEAAKRGMRNMVENLLTHGIKVNERDEKNQYTPLHEAAWNGQVDVVTLLLEKKAAMDMQTEKGWTALHLAASRGHIEVVTELLEKGADVAVVDHDERTAWRTALSFGQEKCAKELRRRWIQVNGEDVDALHNSGNNEEDKKRIFEAAFSGQRDIVETLLNRGFNVHVVDTESGNTLLLQAAIGGQVEVIELCHRWGVNIEAENFKGQTAVAVAASFPLASQMLVELGADITHQDAAQRCAIHEAAIFGYTFNDIIAAKSLAIDLYDRFGMTPLHEAVKHGHFKLARQLLNLGASAHVLDRSSRLPLHYAVLGDSDQCTALLVTSGNSTTAADGEGQSPVHCAARAGNIAALTYLLQHGGNPKATDAMGETAAYGALRAHSSTCLAYLLEVCPEIRSIVAKSNVSLLHLAMETGDEDCLQILCENGNIIDFHKIFDITLATRSKKNTPLHCAVSCNFVAGAQVVCQQSTDLSVLLTVRNAIGDTPLSSCVRNGALELMNFLLTQGADLNVKNSENKQNLLHVSADAVLPSADLLQVLLASENSTISTTAFDINGYQPLHVAVRNPRTVKMEHCEVLRVLLTTGVSVDTTTQKSNMTALHCAAECGHLNACRVLLEHGADATLLYEVSFVERLSARELAERGGFTEIVKLLDQRTSA